MAPISVTIKGTVHFPQGYKLGAAQLCVGVALAADLKNLKPVPEKAPDCGHPHENGYLDAQGADQNTGKFTIELDGKGGRPQVEKGTSLYVVFPSSYKNDEGFSFTLPLGAAVLCQATKGGETIEVDAHYELVGCQVGGGVQREDLEDPDVALPFDGVPVLLLDAKGAEAGKTSTDAEGRYCFQVPDAAMGQRFTLRFTPEMPFTESLLTLSPSEFTIQTVKGFQSNVPTLTYRVARAQVNGQVNNGRQGLGGVTATLTDQETGNSSTVPTDPSGFYQFPNLTPGNYQLSFPNSITDGMGRSWELKDGRSGSQSIKLAAGEIVTAKTVSYQLEEHKIIWTVTSNGQPAAGKLVEVVDLSAPPNLIAEGRTDNNGRVVLLLAQPGDYKVRVFSDERARGGVFDYPVSVHSTFTGNSDVAPPAGPSAMGTSLNGGGATMNGELKEAVVDSQAYPLLTESVSAPSAPGPAIGAPGAAPGVTALGATVEAALRDVLGWRPKAGDPKAFLTALGQSFQLQDVEGHVESKWTPRSYAVTVADDLGAVTGAQASIYDRARVALDQSLPLLDGLYPLTPESTQEDIDAIRAIVRSEFTQLVTELGIVGGPRVQRVDEMFRFLLGASPVPDAESVGGHLEELRDRLSLERKYVNTVEDEQNYTSYLIINDYVIGLKSNWDTVRKYFDRTGSAEPFLGTQLVLVSQSLTATAEAVQQATFAMDSVFLGPAERQTIQLWYKDGGTIQVTKVTGDDDVNLDGTYTFRNAPPLLVSELLDWVYRVATEEAPRMIQDSGKDGVIAIFQVVNRLRKLVKGSLTQAAGGVQDTKAQALPAGYATPRVLRALAELAGELDEVAELGGQISLREKGPRERLESQEVLDALRDPDVIQAIKTIAALRTSQAPRPPGRTPILLR